MAMNKGSGGQCCMPRDDVGVEGANVTPRMRVSEICSGRTREHS
jgi:hypothetical protein